MAPRGCNRGTERLQDVNTKMSLPMGQQQDPLSPITTPLDDAWIRIRDENKRLLGAHSATDAKHSAKLTMLDDFKNFPTQPEELVRVPTSAEFVRAICT